MTTKFQQINTSKPSILLVGSGVQAYREYLLKMVSKHANVCLFSDNDVAWEAEYVTHAVKVNTLDPVDMKAKIPEGFTPNGVLCWDEIRIIQSSKLAKSLGLPGGDVDSIIACRDKYTTRTLLEKAGLAQPKCILTNTIEEAQAAIKEIGYPVIIKPRAMAASYGVCKINSDDQLEDAFASATKMTEICETLIAESYSKAKKSNSEETEYYYRKGVLVEQYVTGKEVSIDSTVVDGKLTPLFLAHKRVGYAPYFEEVGHVVDANEPLLNDESLIKYLENVHAALNFTQGCTHTELMLCEDGPKLIEVNARIGGDLIPYIGQIATQIDLGKVAVDATCGQTVDIGDITKTTAAIQYYYPPEDCLVNNISFKDEISDPKVIISKILASAGQKLLLPPKDNVGGRMAYCIAQAVDAVECEQALLDIQNNFELEMEPV